MQLYLDADVLCYESAFASQKTLYTYKTQEFPDSKAAQEYCTENDLDYRALRREGEITSHIEVLPEAAARMITQQKLDKIIRATGATKWDLLLSGQDNFRFRVAKTRGYKANRDEVPKPEHYAYVRALLESWGAEVVEGIEADDAMGIAICAEPTACLATIDKDLNCIPGLHYNWDKGIKYKVGLADSIWYFHRQMLMGDSTDNIPGIPGTGETKATKIMEPYRHCRASEGWAAVQQAYLAGPFEFKDGTTTPADVSEYMAEQGALLWIQRRPDEFWTPQLHEKVYV